MACSLEALTVATDDYAGAAVEVVATSVDDCSAKYVSAYNDVDTDKGMASKVADSEEAGAVEDFDRI